MSGFCGIWNRDRRPVDEAVLARMSAAIAHRGPDGEGMRIEGPLGLAHRLQRIVPESRTEVQPISDAAGRCLVFDGRLDERTALLEGIARIVRSAPPPAGGAPDPELALAWLGPDGPARLARLEGEFALALFDPREEYLLLARDALGVKPLYWWADPHTVLFASEIKAILAHPTVSPRPDEEYLAVRLLGQNREGTGDRTFFAGVHSLEPAHYLRFRTEGEERRRYWDFAVGTPFRPASPDNCAEAFREALEKAVHRRLRSLHPVAVSVSGGLDSSSIFGLGHDLRRRHPDLPEVLGFTYAPPPGSPADEERYLAALERHWVQTITRVSTRSGPVLEHAADVVRHVEAPQLDELAPTMEAFQETIRASGVRVVLSGHWADQFLFDQAYLVDLVRTLRWRTAARHLTEYPRWFPGTDRASYRRQFLSDLGKYLLPGPLVRRLRSGRLRSPRDWYTDRLVHLARISPLNRGLAVPHTRSAHARSLYEQARSAHHVLCLEWDDKMAARFGLQVSFPFFDRDLVDLVLRIPGEILHPGGVPKGLLRRALADVLPPEVRDRDWKADFSFLVNEGVAGDLEGVLELLGADSRSVQSGFVVPSRLLSTRAEVERGLGGPECAVAWSVLDLAGLELWLKEFFGETAAPPGDRP
jgi:asparagine synthase (glutamine-hydrolysing)